MIEHLRGTLLLKTAGHVVLSAGDVGYGVDISHRTHNALPEEGETAELLIRTVVREESITLFGFSTATEREVFDILLTARGVGAKSALAALSTLGADRLAVAVVDKDLAMLQRIPGVGKKTAEQMSLDLKKKLAPLAKAALARDMGLAVRSDETAFAKKGAPDGDGSTPPHVVEAIAALEALGCPALVAQRAVAKAVDQIGIDSETTELVREGLKYRRG